MLAMEEVLLVGGCFERMDSTLPARFKTDFCGYLRKARRGMLPRSLTLVSLLRRSKRLPRSCRTLGERSLVHFLSTYQDIEHTMLKSWLNACRILMLLLVSMQVDQSLLSIRK